MPIDESCSRIKRVAIDMEGDVPQLVVELASERDDATVPMLCPLVDLSEPDDDEDEEVTGVFARVAAAIVPTAPEPPPRLGMTARILAFFRRMFR